jgi:hypothetical protein
MRYMLSRCHELEDDSKRRNGHDLHFDDFDGFVARVNAERWSGKSRIAFHNNQTPSMCTLCQRGIAILLPQVRHVDTS